nr:hypothetical protein [Candidatus Cloacimonadota bacterium]
MKQRLYASFDQIVHKVGLLLVLLCTLHLSANIITIGTGNVLHQGLPIEPVARFSYSQQLLYSSEIGQAGEISQIGFQYNVASESFLQGNKEWSIYLGHSDLSQLSEWIPTTELNQVFSGLLSPEYFASGLPGSGWLTIPLDQSFSYDGVSNLIIAVDENTDGQGMTSDDFFCTQMTNTRTLNFISMSINPDPDDPPVNAVTKTYISNVRLNMNSSNDLTAPQNLHGYYTDGAIRLFWEAPAENQPSGYRLFRDSAIWAELSTESYVDRDVTPGCSYNYSVQALYPGGESSAHSNNVIITVPQTDQDLILYQSFEEYADFSTQIPGYQILDLDGSDTWGWEFASWPQEGNPLGWIVFTPSATTPPVTDITPPSGGKMLMSASALNPPNNDWLILPNLHLGSQAKLSFMARSYTPSYGLERLRVLISVSDAQPTSFTPLHPEEWLSIPASWTEYEFDLGSFANQDVNLALNAVSLDAFALFVDDIIVEAESGHVGVDVPEATLPRPYPNPCNKSFSLKSEAFFDLDIYNLRGQLVSSARGLKSYDSSAISFPAGIYFVRIRQNGRSQTFKQVIIP